MENARKAQLIKKAYLCNNSLELVFAVVKTKIEGNSKTKDDILTAEIINYFNSKLDMSFTNDNFEPKLEPNSEDKLINTALVLHGVDFIDTRKIGDFMSFVGSNPREIIQKIIWINDSNCLVVFYDSQKLIENLENTIIDPKQYKLKAEETDYAEGSDNLSRTWF